ncbi:EAL domain-containing protein [Martelella sp. HB161492]|uniref:putative bifunctional diguanylate cyclase/phosphodiesterase n=1 Tax=Martelella sp. HB161492 TaxID=2720726 RepID=UPI001592305E|nr:EAL domain-containing protein [Martelella sp. HB161492]
MALLIRVNSFEHLYRFSRAHESWQLDEFFTALMVASIALAVQLIIRAGKLRREVQRRRLAESKAAMMARHDPLTGLANRRLFEEECGRRMVRARRRNHVLALIFLDLDRFKQVNDNLGHSVGDQLLQALAERLSGALRPYDFVARLGGDEFAIILDEEVDDELVAGLSQRILTAVARPVRAGGRVIDTTVSLGVAMYPQDASDWQTLIQRADIAMYQAKAAGRNRCAYFDALLDKRIRERLTLEEELRKGLARGEVVPFYQPIINLDDESVNAVEVLARWQNPRLGFLEAGQFIPVAEDAGLIDELYLHLLRTACRDAQSWASETPIAVNVAPGQLRHLTFCEKTIAVLHETGLPASRLELEITETALVENIETAHANISRLTSVGVRIVLDDFGTGYSSLRHLREFPFDRVKIDRSFVMGLGQNEESEKIFRSMLGLCATLGLPTVAEGIEAEDQAEWIRHQGGVSGQGYLYSRPVPAQSIAAILDRPKGR